MTMRRILVISYHFAPYGGGGVIRIHNFVKYLPLTGYMPVVLTAQEEYYENTYRTPDLLKEFKEDSPIFRTRCLEPAQWGFKDKIYGVTERKGLDRVTLPLSKHLIKPWLIPDRNITWLPFALSEGLKIINSNNIDLIFSTSPPFTSNLIAYLLSKHTRIPYIIDYRDDWVGNPLYSSRFPLKKRLEKSLEKMLVSGSRRVICASEDSVNLFRTKFPDIREEKFVLIRNGFDPEYFEVKSEGSMNRMGKLKLVYTGSLTPGRNPRFFLQAMERVVSRRPQLANRIEIRFIGLIPDRIREIIQKSGVRDMVRCEGNLSPREVARILCREADVCLLFQRMIEGGKTAIPGKVYEYLAARKPIFCMAEGGATVRFLKNLGCDLISDYEDIPRMTDLISRIIGLREKGQLSFALNDQDIQKFSRKSQTLILSRVFDSLIPLE